ncbi:MAG: apolipoprotein N-acyltransferase [Magnetococcus sp. WYHC-3]
MMLSPSVLALFLSPLLGAMAALGFAPSPHPAWGVVALTLWLFLLGRLSPRRAALAGWLMGLGHFTLGNTWLLTSLHDNGGIPLPLAWGAVVLLAAVLALYPTLFALAATRLPRHPLAWTLGLPPLWVVSELLRDALFTGFPWNPLGQIWEPCAPLFQLAADGGVFLLSAAVVLPAAALAGATLPGQSFAARLLSPLLALLMLTWGWWRGTALLEAPRVDAPPLRVVLVQGNIPQSLKWDEAFRDTTLERYEQLTTQVSEPADLVLWPETAVPLFLEVYPEVRDRLAELVRAVNAPLLTGVPTALPLDKKLWRYHNSMILLDALGNVVSRYDKHHLVPFGEYIPLRRFLPWAVEKLTAGAEDFTPGPGPGGVVLGGDFLGTLVCYEVIFPWEVAELVARKRPRALLNVTNDGWFGPAARPQHLAMARLRAIETRTPLARAANTGISAAFDSRGRELTRIEADSAGAEWVALPAPEPPGLFVTLGRWWLLLWLLPLGAAFLPWRRVGRFESRGQWV